MSFLWILFLSAVYTCFVFLVIYLMAYFVSAGYYDAKSKHAPDNHITLNITSRKKK